MGLFDKMGPRREKAQEIMNPTTNVKEALGEGQITEKEIVAAQKTLDDYKNAKAYYEKRVVEDEEWYKLRHWRYIRNKDKRDERPQPEPSSAWLFNAILNKHADAMDNYPEPIVLPRERSDEKAADTLSEILPVVLETNDFEQTYSDQWWEKLKHGAAIYGVFWDPDKLNGLGDISIKGVDPLKIFWEPGITDIQKSKNLFIVELIDEEALNAMYPEFGGELKGESQFVKQYVTDTEIDLTDKALVVDWYYKKRVGGRNGVGGRDVLHYCKYCGKHVLYASENEPDKKETGWYDHGMYPIVIDNLFPEKGSPVGWGYVALCKDPQLYIDKLSANILENSMMGSKKRFFVSSSTAINEKELLDWNKPIVHVEGEIGDEGVREINVAPLNGIYVQVANMKIDEMKETCGNRDVNSGSAGSGITSGAAISALQEAGNKTARDMLNASYRAHRHITELCLELMRQFYDETRSFRITNETSYEFVDFSNKMIKDQPLPIQYPGEDPVFRKPIFDIKIKAQKRNPFSRMEQNERAKELYAMGFFQPEAAQAAMGALQMMDFEGIEDIRDYVKNGQTLMNIVQQQQMQLQQMAGMLGQMTGIPMQGEAPNAVPQQPTTEEPEEGTGPDAQAKKQMTPYAQKLASKSRPAVD